MGIKHTRLMIRSVSAALALALVCLCGCGGRESKDIRCDLSENIEHLDPQFAEQAAAVTVIENCFDGLVREDAGGEISAAVAESWDISASGLVYTFTLRSDAVWSDGGPVTADDFVFAFERLFDLDYPSPYAELFASVSGAAERLAIIDSQPEETEDRADGEETEAPQENIFSSEAAESEETAETQTLPKLGVTAKNDRTLVITLKEQNPSFLERLCSTAAMPCRRDFFTGTRGKYGLGVSYLLYNGEFVLSSWVEGSYLELTKNEGYFQSGEVLPQTVMLYINKENTRQRFIDGKTDFYKIATGDSELLDVKGITVVEVENQIWALVFNTKNEFTGIADIRRALVSSVDFDRYVESGRTPQSFTVADSLVAPSACIGTQQYSELCEPAEYLGFDSGAAADFWSSGTAGLEGGSPSSLTLLIPESSGLSEFGGWLQSQWLETLSFVVNPVTLADSEYRATISSGNWQLALVLISSSDAGPEGTLGSFATDSGNNLSGYSNSRLDELLRQGLSDYDPERRAACYRECEEILSANAVAVPFFCQSSYYAFGKNVTGIDILPDGELLFRGAYR